MSAQNNKDAFPGDDVRIKPPMSAGEQEEEIQRQAQEIANARMRTRQEAEARVNAAEEERRQAGMRRSPIYPSGDETEIVHNKKSTMMQQLMPILIAAGIAFLMINFMAPTKSAYQSDITRIEKDLLTMQSTEKAIAGSAEAARVAAVGAQTKADATSNALSGISGTIGQLASKQELANYASKASVDSINNTIAGKIAEGNSKQNTDLATLQEKVKKLEERITTTTTTGNTGWPGTSPGIGGVITPGGITATVLGNSFTGSQMLSFSTISANTTATQSFVFQIANGMERRADNIQLAVGLQIMDANGGAFTPIASVTFSVTSPGMSTMWTEQGTGVAYFRGFINSSSSVFQGLGNTLSQGPGIANYTLTITAKNDPATAAQGPFNIAPLVRVISFT